MITPESFGENRRVVDRAFDAVNQALSRRTGRAVCFALARELDQPTLERMLELEREIFTVEDNVYSPEDIQECLVWEDSFLLLLTVDRRLEGYVFGYDEDPGDPMVEGTDYFVDSAVVSLEYERLGIGTTGSILVFLMVYLLGYRKVGITTELKDKTGRELVSFYRKLGFEDANTKAPDSYGMRIDLDADMLASVLGAFGVSLDDVVDVVV